MPRTSSNRDIGYAESRRQKRQFARERIHVQVLHPIDTPSLLRDPLSHPGSPISGAVATLKLVVAAVAIHGFIILVFAVVNDHVGKTESFKRREAVVMQVVETPPPPPPLPVEEEEEPEAVAPDFPTLAQPEPEPVPEPKVEQPKPKAQPKKPKEQAEPAPEPKDNSEAPEPAPRRRVGINYESTVQGGQGPTFSTGTSRMGVTQRIAVDPKEAAKKPPPGVVGVRGGTGSSDVRQQRVAANIPTRDTVFVKPKRVRARKPPYPSTLKAQGIEGDVKVRVNIDAKGKVTQVTVLKGSGHAAFDSAAKSAALSEQFQSATRDGKPVAFTLSYSYRFRIEEN